MLIYENCRLCQHHYEHGCIGCENNKKFKEISRENIIIMLFYGINIFSEYIEELSFKERELLKKEYKITDDALEDVNCIPKGLQFRCAKCNKIVDINLEQYNEDGQDVGCNHTKLCPECAALSREAAHKIKTEQKILKKQQLKRNIEADFIYLKEMYGFQNALIICFLEYIETNIDLRELQQYDTIAIHNNLSNDDYNSLRNNIIIQVKQKDNTFIDLNKITHSGLYETYNKYKNALETIVKKYGPIYKKQYEKTVDEIANFISDVNKFDNYKAKLEKISELNKIDIIIQLVKDRLDLLDELFQSYMSLSDDTQEQKVLSAIDERIRIIYKIILDNLSYFSDGQCYNEFKILDAMCE